MELGFILGALITGITFGLAFAFAIRDYLK